MSLSHVINLGHGAKWYVRPLGTNYGAEDGTSYEDAWEGFAAIDWDVIEPGDTLYVAGTHYGPANFGTPLRIPKSGEPGRRIKISSCEQQYGATADDAGTIWGGPLVNNWSADSDVYSSSQTWLVDPWYPFAVEVGGTVLRSVYSLAECQALPGSIYCDTATDTAYYNPSGGSPDGVVLRAVSALVSNENSHIEVIGLSFKSGLDLVRFAVDRADAEYIVKDFHFKECRFEFAITCALRAYGPIEDVYIEDCEIVDCTAGFYHVARNHNPTVITGPSDRVYFRRNECWHTENIDRRESETDRKDGFRIKEGELVVCGSLGGINNLVQTDNYIHDWKGEGINSFASYSVDGVTCNDYVVERNWIEIDSTGPEGTQKKYLSGVMLWGANSTDLGDRFKRARICNNVIIGAKLMDGGDTSVVGGIRVKLTQMTDPDDRVVIDNNTIIDCYAGVNFASAAQTNDDAPAIFRNNIIAEPQSGGYFIRMAAMDYQNFEADHNIYHGSAAWKWNGGTDTSDIATWRTSSGEDANSLTSDPLLDGSYIPSAESPAVNAGTDTGLTDDYLGNPRPVGAYDIGAYERQ